MAYLHLPPRSIPSTSRPSAAPTPPTAGPAPAPAAKQPVKMFKLKLSKEQFERMVKAQTQAEAEGKGKEGKGMKVEFGNDGKGVLRIDDKTTFTLVPPKDGPALTDRNQATVTSPRIPSASGSGKQTKQAKEGTESKEGREGKKRTVLAIPKGTPQFVLGPPAPAPTPAQKASSSAAVVHERGNGKEREREVVVARMKRMKEEEERRKRERQIQVLDVAGDPGRGRSAIARARVIPSASSAPISRSSSQIRSGTSPHRPALLAPTLPKPTRLHGPSHLVPHPHARVRSTPGTPKVAPPEVDFEFDEVVGVPAPVSAPAPKAPTTQKGPSSGSSSASEAPLAAVLAAAGPAKTPISTAIGSMRRLGSSPGSTTTLRKAGPDRADDMVKLPGLSPPKPKPAEPKDGSHSSSSSDGRPLAGGSADRPAAKAGGGGLMKGKATLKKEQDRVAREKAREAKQREAEVKKQEKEELRKAGKQPKKITPRVIKSVAEIEDSSSSSEDDETDKRAKKTTPPAAPTPKHTSPPSKAATPNPPSSGGKKRHHPGDDDDLAAAVVIKKAGPPPKPTGPKFARKDLHRVSHPGGGRPRVSASPAPAAPTPRASPPPQPQTGPSSSSKAPSPLPAAKVEVRAEVKKAEAPKEVKPVDVPPPAKRAKTSESGSPSGSASSGQRSDAAKKTTDAKGKAPVAKPATVEAPAKQEKRRIEWTSSEDESEAEEPPKKRNRIEWTSSEEEEGEERPKKKQVKAKAPAKKRAAPAKPKATKAALVRSARTRRLSDVSGSKDSGASPRPRDSASSPKAEGSTDAPARSALPIPHIIPDRQLPNFKRVAGASSAAHSRRASPAASRLRSGDGASTSLRRDHSTSSLPGRSRSPPRGRHSDGLPARPPQSHRDDRYRPYARERSRSRSPEPSHRGRGRSRSPMRRSPLPPARATTDVPAPKPASPYHAPPAPVPQAPRVVPPAPKEPAVAPPPTLGSTVRQTVPAIFLKKAIRPPLPPLKPYVGSRKSTATVGASTGKVTSSATSSVGPVKHDSGAASLLRKALLDQAEARRQRASATAKPSLVQAA